MGFFRRFKPSDYTADECEEAIRVREVMVSCMNLSRPELNRVLVEWACFRELLARHRGENASPLDVDAPLRPKPKKRSRKGTS